MSRKIKKYGCPPLCKRRRDAWQDRSCGDAELIARMVAKEHVDLHPWVPPTPEQREINRLLKRRAKLSSLRQALGMSLKGVDGFAAELKALRKRFDQVIARIDQR
ncbi:MAG: hypothetical protein WCE58_10285, partial [Gallionella sp.]